MRIRSPCGHPVEASLLTNTVVTKDNVEHLPDTVGLVTDMGASLVVISNTTPEGHGEDRYEQLAVPLSKLAEIMPKVPRFLQKKEQWIMMGI